MNTQSTAGRVLALGMAVMVAACSSTTGPEADPVEAVLDQGGEIVLKIGDDVRLTGTSLRLGVANLISDSRCPVDVTCVWAGDTEVEIGVALGTGPTFPRRIHLNSEAGPTSTEQGTYRVTLVGVDPPAQSSVDIEAVDYRFRFKVEEIG